MAKIIIKETQEVKELNHFIATSPENLAGHYISEYSEIPYNSDENAFEMTSEEFAWWEEYFSNSEKDNETIAELGIETADYADRFTSDLGDEHAIWQEIFDEVRNNK